VFYLAGARNPLSGSHAFYMLIETSGSDEAHNVEVGSHLLLSSVRRLLSWSLLDSSWFAQKVSKFLESAMEEKLIDDGTFAQDSSQVRLLWTEL
jgi:hypothetical protein